MSHDRNPHNTSTSGAKAAIFLGILLLIGGGMVLLSISSPPEPKPRPAASVVARAPDTAAMRVAQEKRSADSVGAAAKFTKLRQGFAFHADSIEGGGWYTARVQLPINSYDRSFLVVHVAWDGRTYLASQYTGDDWIFHDHIVVRIGEQVLRSVPIPSYSDQNDRTNGSGSVWEILSMTGGEDNGILAAIAAAGDEVIRVRFEGDQRAKDIVLTKRDRDAIRAGVQLGALLSDWPFLRESHGR